MGHHLLFFANILTYFSSGDSSNVMRGMGRCHDQLISAIVGNMKRKIQNIFLKSISNNVDQKYAHSFPFSHFKFQVFLRITQKSINKLFRYQILFLEVDVNDWEISHWQSQYCFSFLFYVSRQNTYRRWNESKKVKSWIISFGENQKSKFRRQPNERPFFVLEAFRRSLQAFFISIVSCLSVHFFLSISFHFFSYLFFSALLRRKLNWWKYI